jgi:hypothetical protein
MDKEWVLLDEMIQAPIRRGGPSTKSQTPSTKLQAPNPNLLAAFWNLKFVVQCR